MNNGLTNYSLVLLHDSHASRVRVLSASAAASYTVLHCSHASRAQGSVKDTHTSQVPFLYKERETHTDTRHRCLSFIKKDVGSGSLGIAIGVSSGCRAERRVIHASILTVLQAKQGQAEEGKKRFSS